LFLRAASESRDNVEIMRLLITDTRIGSLQAALSYARYMDRLKTVMLLLSDPRINVKRDARILPFRIKDADPEIQDMMTYILIRIYLISSVTVLFDSNL